MSNIVFIKADEIAKDLGVSTAYAYKLIKKMNGELKNKGFITISGRVSRKYYFEKIYGAEAQKGEQNASVQG